MVPEIMNLGLRLDRSSWLSEKELSIRWSVSRRTLQRWRMEGSGPNWMRVGKSVRYLIGFVERHELDMLLAEK